MEQEKEIIIGNVTTIINTVSLMIAGLIFGLISAIGLKLPIDQYSLAGIIGLIIGTIFSYVNAKYHNTYFDTDENVLKINADNLTDAQVQAINNFVKNASELNTVNVAGRDYNRLNDTQIEQIDPAGQYEQIGDEDGC